MDARMLREMRRSGSVTVSSDGTSTYRPGELHPHDQMAERLERMTAYAKSLEETVCSDGWGGVIQEEQDWWRKEHGITDADMGEGS